MSPSWSWLLLAGVGAVVAGLSVAVVRSVMFYARPGGTGTAGVAVPASARPGGPCCYAEWLTLPEPQALAFLRHHSHPVRCSCGRYGLPFVTEGYSTVLDDLGMHRPDACPLYGVARPEGAPII